MVEVEPWEVEETEREVSVVEEVVEEADRVRDRPAVALVVLALPIVLHPLERRDDLLRLPSWHGCQRSGNDQLPTGLPH